MIILLGETLSAEIFVTFKKIRHFRPTKFRLIRYTFTIDSDVMIRSSSLGIFPHPQLLPAMLLAVYNSGMCTTFFVSHAKSSITDWIYYLFLTQILHCHSPISLDFLINDTLSPIPTNQGEFKEW